ncbi:methionine synthase [Aldersonia sp. NBC_00410]|uniref:methionine synthase n=1 Tax=Aldersonia sp. NBC_00410 TaxID=2975954 RepID=UPI0022557D9A|nr:methionine synthase [Aldersonia sp. NBC_00410]MCX5046098.1 methionine synthase [Aldersonia sp. NBC_00410]
MTADEVRRSPFAGVATGVGSWPGIDPREAAATMVGELADLPYLPELPGRGLGADLVGRASALLVDMQFDTTTRAYRIASRPSAVSRLALDYLRADLDAIEEAWEIAGRSGGTFKVQSVGALTLASEVELANGHRALTDSGAVRDIAGSLAEGLAQHVGELRRRLGAEVVVQLDEPLLGTVLAGSLPGVTGLDQVRAMPAPDALDILDSVIRVVGAPVVVHTCAASPPLALLRRSGAAAVSIDVAQLTARDLDGVGELLDAGKDLLLGLIPTTEPEPRPTWREVAKPAVTVIDRLGFPRTVLRDRVGVTPACGLSGASLDWARVALRLSTDVTDAFAQEAETLTYTS